MVTKVAVWILCGVLGAGAGGAGVYVWQSGEKQKEADAHSTEITEIRDEKTSVEQRLQTLEADSSADAKEIEALRAQLALATAVECPEAATCPAVVECPDATIEPVVVYEREGLLTPAQKTRLQTRLVEPFFDYYNEDSIEYLTMAIEVPTTTGAEYNVLAISRSGAYTGFLFGARDTDFGWWEPECMDVCTYSAAFSAKYPEIVE